MKPFWKLSGLGSVVACGVLFAGSLLIGCATTEEPVFRSAPGISGTSEAPRPATTSPETKMPPAAAPSSAVADSTGAITVGNEPDRFAPGDQVIVTFSGSIDTTLQPHDERIKEDGTITMPLIGSIKAAGKTPGELQSEITDLYVPKYYVRLTVTVKSQERAYYVGGEVRNPNRYPYLGATTVTKAIQSAGDFTDFAKKTGVIVIRADGKTKLTVNCKKVIAHPEDDPPIYPGDKIHVPRRFW